MVHADGAGLNPPGHVGAVIGVGRPDAATEPIFGVVGDPHSVLLAVVRNDREHRPEDLFAGDRLVVADVGKDGGLDEPAAPRGPPAPGDETGALLLRGADVALDPVAMPRGRHRPDHRRRVKRVADRHSRGDGRERIDDLVVAGPRREDARPQVTRLAVIEQRGAKQRLARMREVGILEDDGCRLASELE